MAPDLIDAAARYITFEYTWEYWAVPLWIIFLMALWLWAVLHDRKKNRR